ncbi:MAG: Na+:solute symporter [Leptospiraceae bacterium]|nr:Na+:solute symporter [Leptospiraceae bacterium]
MNGFSNSIDLIVIGIFLFFTFGLSLFFRKRNQSLREYFQSEGKLSWFVAGTGMVATTFAADTPLAVTELVFENGISGNWVWWSMSVGSIITAYFFAPLWKRSGAITDIELIKIRYSGKASEVLRIIKSIYFGLFVNVLVMSWVNLALLKIVKTLMPQFYPEVLVIVFFLFAFVYTAVVGLTGISYLDTFQFFFAMFGCVLLSVYAIGLPEIGGISGLIEKLPKEKLFMMPDFSIESNSKGVWTFVILLCVVWWSSWYPGAEPGGGGYIAQRIMATKNVRSSVYSALYFTIAHYFLRPWPWILVALVGVVLYPGLSQNESGNGFVLVMQKALPEGMFGLLIAGFIAAYLSTIATHLNWGASYIVNDFYKPYVRRNREDVHYIRFSMFIQFVFVVVSLFITFFWIQTVSGVWVFLIECASGIGFVLMARWYWWRINVFSEIGAFVFSIIFYVIGKYGFHLQFPFTVAFTSFSTVACVVLISFFTPSTDKKILENFYKTVKPSGLLWKRWAKSNGVFLNREGVSILRLILLSVAGLGLIFSGLLNWIFIFWQIPIFFIFYFCFLYFTLYNNKVFSC